MPRGSKLVAEINPGERIAGERHIGIVEISAELLLGWLQFQEGQILGARVSEMSPEVIEIVIEHPEMPLMREGEVLQRVCPCYTAHFGENNQLLSIEREK